MAPTHKRSVPQAPTFTEAALLANTTDRDLRDPRAPDVLHVTAVASMPASQGTIRLDPTTHAVTYTPTPYFFGTARFDFTVTDSEGASSTSTATLHVQHVNHPPTLAAQTFSGLQDHVAVIAHSAILAAANDVDIPGVPAERLSIAGVGHATHGSVALDANGDIVFTPEFLYNGPATFDVTVTDNDPIHPLTVTQTDRINLAYYNHPPVANDVGTFTIGWNQTNAIAEAALLAHAGDVDGDGVFFRSAQNPSHGTVSYDGTNVYFTPTHGYQGPASFQFTVVDGHGATATATAYENVVYVAHPPSVLGELFQGLENVSIAINAASLLGNDSSPDGLPLHIAGFNHVVNAGGGFSWNGSTVTFNPTHNFWGTGSFDYLVQDSAGNSTWDTAFIAFQHDVPPVATNATYDFRGAAGGPPGYSPDGTPVSFSVVSDPTHAFSMDASGNWTEGSGFGGDVIYQVTDTGGLSARGTLSFVNFGSSDGSSESDGANPVVIDLEGHGISLIGFDQSTTAIDWRGDGVVERSGWVGPGMGLLAYDPSHSSQVSVQDIEFERIAHAMGYAASTDMEGLAAAFDPNHTGVLDASNPHFNDFVIWVNSNGQPGSGQVETLAQAGIRSIGLEAPRHDVTVDGNTIHRETTVRFADGHTTTAADVSFGLGPPIPSHPSIDPHPMIASNPVPTGLSPTALAANAALPDHDPPADGTALAGALAAMKQAMGAFAPPTPLEPAHDPPVPLDPVPVLAPPDPHTQHPP